MGRAGVIRATTVDTPAPLADDVNLSAPPAPLSHDPDARLALHDQVPLVVLHCPEVKHPKRAIPKQRKSHLAVGLL